jgi:hypothetical protein
LLLYRGHKRRKALARDRRMNLIAEPQWYAVHTRSRHEKFVVN